MHFAEIRLGLALAAAVLPVASIAQPVPADAPPLITTTEATALAGELSGSNAKEVIERLSTHHRMRGSGGYAAAAELIRSRLVQAGLQEVDIIALPADGKIFYGTQRSRPAWDASFAELWEQKQESGRWTDGVRIASWADQPLSLAQDSISGRAEADLVDVGSGAAEADYAGKDVRGKLVLVSGQPSAAAPLAVGKYGAAGIVSWAQNQKQAWWGEDRDLVRWGHLDTWEHPTFAFMVSPRQAQAWKERLARGEAVRLRARVEAGRTPGSYLIPTAIIPGRERDKEVLFSCHLDHPNPGANDNASGCAGILEIARGLNALIKSGKLPQPKRTIRFIWPCEVECTISLLNARPVFATRTLAAIHLDMIGGNPAITKSVLRVEGSPPSLPSFVGDVAFSIARWVNDETIAYADTGTAAFPLVDPNGERDALRAKIGGFSEGSDHQVWAEGSWRVPVVYIADWPDRYIHTTKDVPANIDPTKVKRAMFIAAASAWYLANVDETRAAPLRNVLRSEAVERQAGMLRRAAVLGTTEADRDQLGNLWWQDFQYGQALEASPLRFGLAKIYLGPTNPPLGGHRQPTGLPDPAAMLVYRRVATLKGPMDGFGYSWLDDHLKKAGIARPALLDRPSGRDGPSFGYEALNLVDGRRIVGQIQSALAATVAPVPLQELADYFSALEKLGVIERSDARR